MPFKDRKESSLTSRVQRPRTGATSRKNGNKPEAEAEKPASTVDDNVDALNTAIDEHERWLADPSTRYRLDLSGSTLSRTTLADARWRDRELREANFGSADIGGLDFTDSDLTDANLEQCPNLEPHQFPGAVLRRAKLPERFHFPQLAATEEMSQNCGKYFLTALVGCAYVLLTTLSTTDAALITNSSTSTLPVLETSVSITAFYYWAPLLLVLIGIFYLVNMQQLWKTIALLPAIFADGRDIENATYPWVVNSLVGHYAKRLKSPHPPSDYAVLGGTMLLAYGTVPLTLLVAWLRVIRLPGQSLWIAFLISLSAGIGYACFRTAIAMLAHTPVDIDESQRRRRTILLRSIATGIGLIVIGHVCVRMGLLPFNVYRADLSTRPQDWKGESKEDYEAIAGANLRSQDLTYLYGEQAFLVHADLRGSNLSHADLSFADMRSAFLQQAYELNPPLPASDLYHADLFHARLDDANLTRAYLSQADLEFAHMSNAQLDFANMTDAKLGRASLDHASLSSATLRNADLEIADMDDVDLVGADLRGADLRWAHGISQSQLAGAYGDDTTKLDPGLHPDNNPHWPHVLTDASLKSMRGY